MTVFYTWSFPSLNGPLPGRTQAERLSDIVNVRDWGALANGGDDSTAIQNAINYCISTTGGKTAGGTVFFPAGTYNLNGNILTVGSSDSTIGVQLLGVGGRTTILTTSNTGFLLSKGGETYDNIARIEQLAVTNENTTAGSGAIQLTGNGQNVYNCYVTGMISIDASAATSCSLINVQGQGRDFEGGAGSSYPFSLSGVGIYLGTSCTAVACRFNGAYAVGYALSGEGASCISGSVENVSCGYRLGWAPQITANTNANATTGDTLLQFAASSFQSLTVLVIGRIISGTDIVAGTTITDVNTSGSDVSITLSDAITNNIGSGSTITFTQEAPAIGCTVQSGQTEASLVGIDVYNAKNCLVQANTITGRVAPGGMFQAITAMTWDNGTHVVTVTTAAAHNLTAGVTPITCFGTGTLGQFNPNVWAWATYTPGPMGTSTFTFPGPVADPGTLVVDPTPPNEWCYALQMAMRVRAATECAFINNGLNLCNNAFANVDLDYATLANGQLTGSGQTANNQANNVFIGTEAIMGGWITPSNVHNQAGWQFIKCGATAVEPTRNTQNTISNPYGVLTFASLPGQTDVLQDGPFEAQEFDIIDGSLFGSVPPTPADWGDQVIGGGNGHYKVRYDGTVWRRIG